MGLVINIEGSFDNVNREQVRKYVESLVTDSLGEAPQRVIFHTASGKQSPRERTRQLMALNSS